MATAVRPPEWVWAFGPASAGPEVELTDASTRSLRVRLKDPSEATVGLSGLSPQALHVREGVTDLWVRRNNQALFRGRVTKASDNLSPDGYQLSVTVQDYRELLAHRFILGGDYSSSIAQETTVWNLISAVQGRTGGNLGITKGLWPTTNVAPNVVFKDGEPILKCIQTLAVMPLGFDWDIDADLKANLYYPRRGANKGESLDYGGAVTHVSRTMDLSNFANVVRQNGVEGVAPVVLESPNLATAPEGRWEAMFGDTKASTADMVSGAAQANLDQREDIFPSYTLTLATGFWRGPDHIWVGDTVQYVVRVGRLDVAAFSRVFEINLDVDENGSETVGLVVSAPTKDARGQLKIIGERVVNFSIR